MSPLVYLTNYFNETYTMTSYLFPFIHINYIMFNLIVITIQISMNPFYYRNKFLVLFNSSTGLKRKHPSN